MATTKIAVIGGVTLLCSIKKIVSQTKLLPRICAAVDKGMRIVQAGESCIDQVAIAGILKQTLKPNSSLQLVYVDFENAFDSP